MKRLFTRTLLAGLLAMAIPFLAPGLANDAPTVSGSAHISGQRVTISARGRGMQATGRLTLEAVKGSRRLEVTCLRVHGNRALLTAGSGNELVAVTIVDNASRDEGVVVETTDGFCSGSSASPSPVSGGNYRIVGGDGSGPIDL